MIVMPLVLEDPSDPKKLSELFEAGDPSHSLRHDESMEDLVPGSVAFSSRPVMLPNETDWEATFSVNVAGDISREELATVTRAGV